MRGSSQIGDALTVPCPEEAVAALHAAKSLFQRHLAAWSSDVLALRASGRAATAWPSVTAGTGAWSEAA